VSIIGTNVAQSLAGLSQAEGIEAKNKKPPPKSAAARPRSGDRDLYVAQTESDDAVRALSSNEQEDASEDHKGHNAYTPGGSANPQDAKPTLDVEG
jgi:hypothetical protein